MALKRRSTTLGKDTFMDFLNDEGTFFQMEKEGLLNKQTNILDHHCAGHKNESVVLDADHIHGKAC